MIVNNILDILSVMLGDTRIHLNLLAGITLFRVSTWVLACFCGLWFQWQFNFQRLCSVILVSLVYLVPLGLLLVPAGAA